MILSITFLQFRTLTVLSDFGALQIIYLLTHSSDHVHKGKAPEIVKGHAQQTNKHCRKPPNIKINISQHNRVTTQNILIYLPDTVRLGTSQEPGHL